MPYLLDTNILSELRKGKKADPNVRTWAHATRFDQHYLSVLSIGEIRKGIEVLKRKSPTQAPVFEAWLETLEKDYSAFIIEIDTEISKTWGILNAQQTLPVIDGLIASTAICRNLTVVTRNTSDFKTSGVQLLNPFEFVN